MVVARCALHYWEEPSLSGEQGSGTIFFTHCSLKCIYCQNIELAAGLTGRVVTEDEVARMCLQLQEQQALNINFVTPTHYTPQIIQAVQTARSQGLTLPVVWNTSGYECVDTLLLLEDTVDVFLTDYKYACSYLANRYSNAPDYPKVALAALQKMVELAGPVRFDECRGQKRLVGGVVVRHLILPGALEESKEALRMLFAEFGNTVRYSLMNQYTPLVQHIDAARYPELCTRVSSAEYEALLDFADTLGIEDYYWQEGEACLESFIPQWDY